ncbi:hypothetical protein PIB30_115457, partial [Stylosanthes scabra]|nr:hypothetical protein [Stylosanthes scabra]
PPTSRIFESSLDPGVPVAQNQYTRLRCHMCPEMSQKKLPRLGVLSLNQSKRKGEYVRVPVLSNCQQEMAPILPIQMSAVNTDERLAMLERFHTRRECPE